MPPARRASLLASILLPSTLLLIYACGDSGNSTFDDGLNGIDAGDGSTNNSSSGFIPTDTGTADVVEQPERDGTLEAVIRDFKKWNPGDSMTNPDFENVPTNELPDGGTGTYDGPFTEATDKWFPTAPFKLDIVQDTLGADNIPLYNTLVTYRDAGNRTATTHGKTFFDQWYRDVPGVNVTRKVKIQLTKNEDGVFSYDSAVSGIPLSDAAPGKQFFPINDDSDASTSDAGFGNQGNPHNYHFTVELRTKFTYRGNETFKFSGDDDVFVYINKKLVINIGGIHGALSKEVKLPDVAAEIGLVVGNEYPLDFFQAERHVIESNLRIDTTIDLRPAPIVK